MKIGNIYRPGVHSCDIDDLLPTAAARMQDSDVGALAVVEDGTLAGIITERDLVAALASEDDPTTITAGDYMTTDVLTAAEEEDSAAVARRMLEAGIRHLPVTRERIVIGMVSVRDLLAVETWG